MTNKTILNALENCNGGQYCDDCVLANEHCIQLAVSMIHKLERENKKLKEERHDERINHSRSA